MKSVAIALALGSALTAIPASAQYGDRMPSVPPPMPRAPVQQPAQDEPAQPQSNQGGVKVSKGAYKAIQELQAAVDAKDAASIPAKVAAAQAVAKTDDDHYMVNLLALRGAAIGKDPAAIEQALARVVPTGKLPPATVASLYQDVGALYGQRKQYEQAAAAVERAITLEPTLQRTLLLAEARNAQGRSADAVGLLQKAIGQAKSSGQKVEENWYKRSIAIAYAAKLPNTGDLTRDWLKSYPTSQNWRDALQVYRQTHKLDEPTSLDMYRLARAAKALRGESDYYNYAGALLLKGFPGEAKSVLEEGVAAKAFDKSKPEFSQMIVQAGNRVAADQASLPSSEKSALAAAAAKEAIAVGDAYYGYGDYAKAATLYRAALGKAGADANLVNLKLGAALARSGDKAGAAAAFNAVTGARADVATFWQIYLSING